MAKAKRRTSRGKRRMSWRKPRKPDRNWASWVAPGRHGHSNLRVVQNAPRWIIDVFQGTTYRQELSRRFKACRKKRGKVRVPDVIFGGKPSWGAVPLKRRRRATKKRRTSRR